MGLLAQLRTLLGSLRAFAELSPRARRLLLLYALACVALLAVVGAVVLALRDDAAELVAAYLFPESWRWAAKMLIEHFFAAQTRAVLINAAVSGTLVLISIALFWLKEMAGAAYEVDRDLTGEPIEELPLWEQGYEELKLFILYLTAQMTIIWVGYHPDPWRKHAATALSYLFLFCAFTIDFATPTLQRHRLRYARILRALLAHPVLLVGLGALLAWPPVLAGKLLEAYPAASTEVVVATLFGANLISLVAGVVAGTRVGAALLPATRATQKPGLAPKILGWLLLLGLFAANLWAFGAVGRSIHHKSQVLKCDYSLDLGSFRFHRPGLGGLLQGKVTVGAGVDIEIENPTAIPVEIEDNHVEIVHGGEVVARTSLSPLRIDPGERKRAPVDFKLELEARSLLQGLDLFSGGWSITLYVQVAPGFDFPIYLLRP